MRDDLKNFRAHDYETDTFNLLTAEVAMRFFWTVVALGVILDIFGLL